MALYGNPVEATATKRSEAQKQAVKNETAALAQKYKGSRYAELAEANPYTNYDYELGLWDKIGNMFGMRTNEDKRREEMAQAAREYNSQVTSLKTEDAYNSPEAQAARMRAAGQNPDILGTGDVTEAGQFNEPETTPEVPGGNDEITAQFAHVATSLMSAGNMAIGLIESGINLKKQLNDVESGELKNFDSYFDMAKKFLIETILPEHKGKMTADDGTPIDMKNVIDAAVNQANDYAHDIFFTGRQKRRFQKAVQKVSKTLPMEVETYKKWVERETERQKLAKLKGSAGYSEDDDEMTEFWAAIIQPLEKLAKDQNEFESKLWEERNKWKNEEGKSMPEIQAEGEGAETEAQTAEAKNRKQEATIEKSINGVWNEALKAADDMIKKGGKKSGWGYALKVAILLVRSMGFNAGSQTDMYGRRQTNMGINLGL